MPKPLVECIPNFSEGRDEEKVKSIIQAMTAIKEVNLLDHHSDPDHNRTVVTLIGPPEAIEEAAFQGIRCAAALIDLRNHRGTHPRIGATDVVPLVPIEEISMAECVKMARRLAKRVAFDLKIPVYLYEEAAARPDRKNLEDIRRGQYEGLEQTIMDDPTRKPDFGPSVMGPAGATVIGARNPLIAFNIFLNSKDVEIARGIARKIRTSSGGLPWVKAMGMSVEGLAQVSMNLVNFRETSVIRVFESVRCEAEKVVVRIHHSELVGLIPRAALIDSAVQYMRLTDFSPNQILENRMAGIQPASFLDELAADTPAPGGGSAAAYSGAMAAALVSMVARLTIGRKKYEAVEAQMKEILLQAERLRINLTDAVQQDTSAFNGIMDAFHLPKDTSKQENARNQAIEEATRQAAIVPMNVAQDALSTLALAERLVALGNLNAITDARSAVTLAQSSLTCAAYNIRINLENLHDISFTTRFKIQLHDLEQRAEHIEKDVIKVINERNKSLLV